MRAFVDLSVRWARWDIWIALIAASSRTSAVGDGLVRAQLCKFHCMNLPADRGVVPWKDVLRMLHPTSSVLDRDIRDLGQQTRIYEGPRRARVTLVGALITESNTPAPPPRTTESTHALPASASLDTEHPDGFEIGAERCLHEAIPATQRMRARSGEAYDFCFREH